MWRELKMLPPSPKKGKLCQTLFKTLPLDIVQNFAWFYLQVAKYVHGEEVSKGYLRCWYKDDILWDGGFSKDAEDHVCDIAAADNDDVGVGNVYNVDDVVDDDDDDKDLLARSLFNSSPESCVQPVQLGVEQTNLAVIDDDSNENDDDNHENDDDKMKMMITIWKFWWQY